ncbi:MAG: SpoVA/SpoVAEb family sporulation membrane protein [Clostridia bacterium]|nr:SpoVA/SpoVAEb family sporulation membrane protein [Clostridia bacterium]
MKISNSEYKKMTARASKPSDRMLGGLRAFLIGGAICAFGQGLSDAFLSAGLSTESADLLVMLTLIVLTSVLTAAGVFDKLAKVAGAGTFVPVTGFANSVVSPAMEFSSEGRVLGTAAQMFRIAGPVLVYGSAAAVVYGFFYWLFR